MENKEKDLQKAVDSLNKKYGNNSVMKLTDSKSLNVECFSTGSLGVDLALGGYGLPKGRIVEFYGPESSGKTTLAIHCIAELQKQGALAAFIDAEHAFDLVYAEKIGLKKELTYLSQPDCGETALAVVEEFVKSNAVDIIVVDSVAALVPRAEIEGEMGDSKMGLHARLMSQAMRKLTGIINTAKCTVIFINQLRDKIGVVYGNPETTTGGNALKFYASVRLDIRKIGQLKEGDEINGNRVKVKVAKNKIAPPFKIAEFDLIYGEGIWRLGEIIDLATEMEIITKSGSWYSYNGTKIGQGKEKVAAFLTDKMAAEIEEKVKEKLGYERNAS